MANVTRPETDAYVGVSLDDWQRVCEAPVGQEYRFLEAIAQSTSCDRASLMMLDESSEALVIVAGIGLPPGVSEKTRVPLDAAISGWVASHRQPTLLNAGDDIPEPLRGAIRRPSIVSAMCVPVEASGALLGVLNLSRTGKAPPFTPEDLRLAALTANMLGSFLLVSYRHDRLAAQERVLTLVRESIPSSLIVVDKALRVVSVNRNFLRDTRRRERFTLGKRLADVLPKTLLASAPIEDEATGVFASGRAVEGGKVLCRAEDAPIKVYYYRLLPVKQDDSVERVLLIMDDVSEPERLGREVRKAERHLAGVVDCANELVASTDRHGRVMSWNPAGERVTGYNAEAVEGSLLEGLCVPAERGAMHEMLAGALRGVRLREVEIGLVSADGRELVMSWSCSPMRDDRGRAIALVVVGRDLTEERLLQQHVFQAERMASLGVMAGGIAHELRNPLTIIATSAQLLRENSRNATMRAACLAKITTATERAMRTMSNLLAFAHPGTAEQKRDVDINALLDQTCGFLGDELQSCGVELRRVLAGDSPIVSGNAGLLQQVFINLMLNARDAMPEGGVLVIRSKSGAHETVSISLTDTGVGVPPEHLGRLFDPFFTTKPPGSTCAGLGLSISDSIVRQHAGRIEVKSAGGKGTSMTVLLPRAGSGSGGTT